MGGSPEYTQSRSRRRGLTREIILLTQTGAPIQAASRYLETHRIDDNIRNKKGAGLTRQTTRWSRLSLTFRATANVARE